MSVTILCYSVFSGLTYFATSLWQVAVLRFLVALGVGGEWAVAATLVAEVFPATAGPALRASFTRQAFWEPGWRRLPAWRWRRPVAVRVPDRHSSRAVGPLGSGQGGRAGALAQGADGRSSSWAAFANCSATARWAARAILGLLLAAVGLATFWGVTVAGQNLMHDLLISLGPRRGGGQPTREIRLRHRGNGRRRAGPVELRAAGGKAWPTRARLPSCSRFCLSHRPLYLLRAAQPRSQLLCVLPFFGFFTLGIHAGYAIYFPELFPSRLRATGSGVCFNGGRLAAAPMLWLSGDLKTDAGAARLP